MSDTSHDSKTCRCKHHEEEHRGGVGICMVKRKTADDVVVPCNCFHFIPQVLKGEKAPGETLH